MSEEMFEKRYVCPICQEPRGINDTSLICDNCQNKLLEAFLRDGVWAKEGTALTKEAETVASLLEVVAMALYRLAEVEKKL